MNLENLRAIVISGALGSDRIARLSAKTGSLRMQGTERPAPADWEICSTSGSPWRSRTTTNAPRTEWHQRRSQNVNNPMTITNHLPRIRSHTCVAVKPTFTKLSKPTIHSNFHHPPFPRRTHHPAASKTRSNCEPNLLSKCRNSPSSGVSPLLHTNCATQLTPQEVRQKPELMAARPCSEYYLSSGWYIELRINE
jgi:hypothetical protein